MIFEKVKTVIGNQLGMDTEEIKMSSNFTDDLGIDSLEIFEIVIALEEEFEIEIPNEDIESINNVKGIVEYIETRI